MTSTLSLSGQSEDSLSAARLKLERSAFKGPLGVSHIELGDVAASGFRGFLLQGNGGDAQLNGRIDEDSVDIEGSQLPDWYIELYQNDQLIAIQTTGPDGRYFFEDVPLQFGENRFELQFFGPNGEIESLEEYHFLGPGMLKSGHANYEISAVQNGLTVFSVNDLPETEDQGSAIYASSANFGLTSNLTISGGIESEEVNGERLQSINGGLGFSTSRLYGSLNYLDNPRAQNSLRTSLRTSLGNSNLSLSYTRFFEATELENSFAKWQAGMEITSRVFSVPVKLEANTSETLFTTQNEVALGTTVPLSGSGNFASSLWYNSFEQRLDEETTAASQAGGQSTFNTTMRPWAFRVSAVYGLQPEVELHQLSASSNLFIDNDLSLTLGLRRFSSTDTTLYNAGINWRIGELALSTSVSYDSNERWSGVITASTILVHRPYTLVPALNRRASVNSGSVEARVFEDTSDSEALPYTGNTNIAAVQTWRRATTDENGMAHIHGLPAYRHTDIELDSSTITDYELRPKNQGVSVIPRPGSYTIVDFPLVRTAELEGTIYETRNNENVPIGRALILLNSLDGELVAQTRSEFDGFYLFAGVEPGDYRLTVEPTLESRVIKRPAMVSVESSSGVISGLDYTLRPTQTTPAQPSLLAEKTESQQNGEAEQTSDTAPQTLSLPTLAASLPESASNKARQAPAKPQTEKITTKPQTESPAEQGNWFVQIAAYSSRQTAQASWERIKQDVSVLQDKTAKYSQMQNMTRLLVGPGSSKEAANDLCKQLKADKLDCLVRQVQ
jgi:cell division septation protein DedD